jgi:hypothetical protein
MATSVAARSLVVQFINLLLQVFSSNRHWAFYEREVK